MKKICTCVLLTIAMGILHAQESQPSSTHVGVKWAPTGLILGNVGLQGEYNFGKNSLTAGIGIPMGAHHTFEYDDKDADFNMKATSFYAGYRTYLSRKHMKGFYFEPYFKYVHHSSEGTGTSLLDGELVTMEFTNDYNGVGVGAELGVQFLIRKRVILDFYFLGPEINSAKNHFKSREITQTMPWSSTQAHQAEADIRDFLDKFPFLGDHATVEVDANNKTVRSDFKGALPGYRIGISVGIAF